MTHTNLVLLFLAALLSITSTSALADCNYADQTYSTGAVQDGQVCTSDGTWDRVDRDPGNSGGGGGLLDVCMQCNCCYEKGISTEGDVEMTIDVEKLVEWAKQLD